MITITNIRKRKRTPAAAFLAAALLWGATMQAAAAAYADEQDTPSNFKNFAVFTYDGRDDFVSEIAVTLQNLCRDDEVKMQWFEAAGDLAFQLEQLCDGCAGSLDALAVNLVDPKTADYVIDQVKEKRVPVIFFNREPDEQILRTYSRAFYVGTSAEESGMLQGKLLCSYLKQHPEVDRNKDGIINLVVLCGPSAHQDTQPRTDAVLDELITQGIRYKIAYLGRGDWSHQSGARCIDEALKHQGSIDGIEAVVSNNDSMALGAISMLQRHGFNLSEHSRTIPVFGIDAIPEALTAIKNGTMTGTVMQDSALMAEVIYGIAAKVLSGQSVDEVAGIPVRDGRYFVIPCRSIAGFVPTGHRPRHNDEGIRYLKEEDIKDLRYLLESLN